MYLKTISIAASFLIATIFENQSYLVLLLIVISFYLYWHLFQALTSIFTLENHRKAGVGKSPSQSFLFI